MWPVLLPIVKTHKKANAEERKTTISIIHVYRVDEEEEYRRQTSHTCLMNEQKASEISKFILFCN